MGFLDRLFGSRAKTAEETRFSGEKMVVKAPMDGIILPLEQLPDETFAAAIRAAGLSTESAVIVTNADDLPKLHIIAGGIVSTGTPLFKFE